MLSGSTYTASQFIVFLVLFCETTLLMIAKAIETCWQLIMFDETYLLVVCCWLFYVSFNFLLMHGYGPN